MGVRVFNLYKYNNTMHMILYKSLMSLSNVRLHELSGMLPLVVI